MDSASKTDTVSAPLPETTPDPVLVRMLEIMPLEGEDKEAMASLKEVVASLFPPSPSSEGATSSILTSTGSDLVSGRGAGHLISFAFAIHSCLKGRLF